MSEPIGPSTKNKNDIENCSKKSDFVTISSDIFSNINIKLGLIMFLLGLFIYSDIFIDLFFSENSNTLDGETPTTKGSIIQLTIFCLLLLVVDLLINYKIL